MIFTIKSNLKITTKLEKIYIGYFVFLKNNDEILDYRYNLQFISNFKNTLYKKVNNKELNYIDQFMLENRLSINKTIDKILYKHIDKLPRDTKDYINSVILINSDIYPKTKNRLP